MIPQPFSTKRGLDWVRSSSVTWSRDLAWHVWSKSSALEAKRQIFWIWQSTHLTEIYGIWHGPGSQAGRQTDRLGPVHKLAPIQASTEIRNPDNNGGKSQLTWTHHMVFFDSPLQHSAVVVRIIYCDEGGQISFGELGKQKLCWQNNDPVSLSVHCSKQFSIDFSNMKYDNSLSLFPLTAVLLQQQQQLTTLFQTSIKTQIPTNGTLTCLKQFWSEEKELDLKEIKRSTGCWSSTMMHDGMCVTWFNQNRPSQHTPVHDQKQLMLKVLVWFSHVWDNVKKMLDPDLHQLHCEREDKLFISQTKPEQTNIAASLVHQPLSAPGHSFCLWCGGWITCWWCLWVFRVFSCLGWGQ